MVTYGVLGSKNENMAFVVFEGIDGAGKSTLITLLQKKLNDLQIAVMVTREPGGTPLGEKLRQLLLDLEGDKPVDRTELLLYEAIRAQHVERVIKPALARDQWILCDRYTASTLAFQAGGRGLDREPIDWLNHFATGGLEPNLFVLLDLPISEGQMRMQNRVKDRMEAEAMVFHQQVRDFYLKLAQQEPSKWLVLDAMQPPEELFVQLVSYLDHKAWQF